MNEKSLIGIGFVFLIAALIADQFESKNGGDNQVNVPVTAEKNVAINTAQLPSGSPEDLNDNRDSSDESGIAKSLSNLIASGHDGNSMLMIFAEKGELEAVDVLIKKGIDVNKTDNDNYTALQKASAAGQTEVVKRLLAAGAKSIVGTYSSSPISLASAAGHLDTVQVLLDVKPQNHEIKRAQFFRAYAVLSAIKGEHFDIVKLITKEEYGGKQNLPKFGLHMASLHKSMDIVNYLLEQGVNVNEEDNRGRTPIFMATMSKNPQLLKLLIANGANVNIADKNGWTPLMEASVNGYPQNVQVLLEAGAKVNAIDKDNNSALSVAENPQVIKILKQAKARK